jgi:polyribonucleotide nucleotidyltransferase
MSVGCEGEYKNIAKFINRLEKNVLVTDIYGSHIYMDKNSTTTIADINISVWGVNH